jgi:hypothetical protein
VVRTVSSAIARLLLAGAAISFAGVAVAQSTNNEQPQQPSAGGLILPGTVQSPQQGASPAAGTIGSPAAGTVGAQPQQQRPAATAAPQAAPQQGAGPAAQQQARPAAPAKPTKPGTLKGEWKLQPQVFTDGSFKMCAVGAEFDNNLHLLFLRNPSKNTQMVLGIPGAQMPPGQRTGVKLSVDGKVTRELGAIVSQPNALAIGLGDDAELMKALGSGSVLSIEVPGDTASFQLKGTTKALSDLGSCVDKGVAGTLQLPPPSEPVIDPSLAKMLVDAGLQSARAIPVDKIPPQQRPGDYAWQIGDKVLGSVRSFPLAEAAGDFAKVSDTYAEQLKKSCEGTYTPAFSNIEALPGYKLRTGTVTCDTNGNKIHVAVVMQFIELPKQQGQEQALRVLNVFSHESADAEKAQADNAMQAIAKVLREKGKEPLKVPGQQQQQAPAAAAPAGTKK